MNTLPPLFSSFVVPKDAKGGQDFHYMKVTDSVYLIPGENAGIITLTLYSYLMMILYRAWFLMWNQCVHHRQR